MDLVPSDFVAVLIHINDHPLPKDKSTLIVASLFELCKKAAFRKWFIENTSEENKIKIMNNVHEMIVCDKCNASDGFGVLRHFCVFGKPLQASLYDLMEKELNEKLDDVNMFQLCVNMITGNKEVAEKLAANAVFFEKCSLFLQDKGEKSSVAIMALLYNLYNVVGNKKEIVKKIVKFSPFFDKSENVWFSSMIRCMLENTEEISFEEMVNRFGTTPIFRCFEYFPKVS